MEGWLRHAQLPVSLKLPLGDGVGLEKVFVDTLLAATSEQRLGKFVILWVRKTIILVVRRIVFLKKIVRRESKTIKGRIDRLGERVPEFNSTDKRRLCFQPSLVLFYYCDSSDLSH